MSRFELDPAESPSGATTANDVPRLSLGVIGLGRMGEVFARNFLAAGYAVAVYDRRPERTEALVELGARPMASLAEIGAQDAVFTSLSNDEALAAVALDDGGLVHTMKTAAVHVSMSTVSPALSRRLSEAHAHAGQGFVAAPVLGNPDLARAQQLFVIAAGDRDDVRTVASALQVLGQRVFYVGEDAGTASLMKLAANALTAMTMQSLGEVFTLLRKNGVPSKDAFELLTATLFDGKVHKAYGGKIVAERYRPPGMTATLAAKDLRLVLAEAETARAPMPVTSLVHDRLLTAMARGWSEFDWSVLGLLAAADGGLDREDRHV